MKFYFLSILMTFSLTIFAQNGEKPLREYTLSDLQKEFVGKKVIITHKPVPPEGDVLYDWELVQKKGSTYVTKSFEWIPSKYLYQKAEIITILPGPTLGKKMKSKTNAFGEQVVNKNPYVKVIVKFGDGTMASTTTYPSIFSETIMLVSVIDSLNKVMSSIIPEIIGDTLYAVCDSRLFKNTASIDEMLSFNNDVKAEDFPRFEPIIIKDAKYIAQREVLILKLQDTNNKIYFSYVTSEEFNTFKNDYDSKLKIITSTTGLFTKSVTKLFSEKEVRAIKKGIFFKGMSAAALQLSIGFPDKENKNSYGGDQLVYHGGRLYIYLDKDNETVESWQFQE